MDLRTDFTRMDQSSREQWMTIGRATMDLQAEVPEH
ncbi:MAG: hypothetical protein RL385_2092, partial [Pseudomonadota bacterium]